MGDGPLCDTCGGPCHGGVRRYIGADGDERVGCEDGHACAAAFFRLSWHERRQIRKAQKSGDYLRRDNREATDGTT